MSAVLDFYNGKTIFLTGGTGFMGKVYLHRLLTCCPNVERIYVLIRPSHNHSAQDRLSKILKGAVFETTFFNRKDLLKKIVPLSGDIVGPDLGLRHEDLELLFESVSLVVHTAATVKFDEALKVSVDVNVYGTKKLLGLCRNMKQLEAFIHVSTAYSNCHRKTIEEIVYDPIICPNQLMRAFDWMDEKMVKSITPTLIPPWPNTYTYAKALAESVVASESEDLRFPIAIVRPSIIGAAVAYPCQGYIDNYNGPSGLLAAIGKGALRTMLGDKNAIADIVPVDFVADLVIVVPPHLSTMKQPKSSPVVYNFVSGPVKPITWGYIQNSSCLCYMKNPIEKLYRIPNPQFTQNRLLHKFWTLIDHMLPAYLMDFVSKIQGRKPTVVNSYGKLHKALLCLDYFTQRSWNFDNKNVVALWNSVSPADKKVFNFDINSIDWKSYMEQFCLGVKTFLLHEELQSLPQARKNLARRINLSRTVFAILVMIGLSVLGRHVGLLRRSWIISLSIIIRLLLLLSKLLRTKE